MIRILTLAAIVAALAVTAMADIPRPDPTPSQTPKQQKSIDTRLDIRLDASAKDAKLIIPKSQIKLLRAQIEQLDNNGDTAALTTGGSFGRLQTIVSGLFLSLAIIFGGVWFFRSGRVSTRAGKTVAGLLVVATLASAATLVYANAGPPAAARSITGKTFSEAVHTYGFAYGRIKLEVGSDEDDTSVSLVVPDPPDKAKTDE